MRTRKKGFWTYSIYLAVAIVIGAGGILPSGCAGGGKWTRGSHSSGDDGEGRQQPRDGTHKRFDKYSKNKTEAVSYEDLFCNPSAQQLSEIVSRIAADMEQQKLYYNTQPMTDCSGIMHRVFLQMRQRCATLPFPSYQHYRSSRAIAQWFYDKGGLVIVDNPLEMDRFIRPGAIMFYGYSANTGNKVNTRTLFGRNGISHVGIVVDVTRNARGQVTGYTLFHGRSRGKAAKVTRYHLRQPGRHALPPYGNYNQHWLAVAFVIVDDPSYADQ